MENFTDDLKKTFSLKDRFIHFKNKWKRKIERKFEDRPKTIDTEFDTHKIQKSSQENDCSEVIH